MRASEAAAAGVAYANSPGGSPGGGSRSRSAGCEEAPPVCIGRGKRHRRLRVSAERPRLPWRSRRFVGALGKTQERAHRRALCFVKVHPVEPSRPIGVPLERCPRPHHEQPSPRPRQRHVHPPPVLQKPHRSSRVASDRAHQHEVRFLALEAVDGGHHHPRPLLRQHLGQKNPLPFVRSQHNCTRRKHFCPFQRPHNRDDQANFARVLGRALGIRGLEICWASAAGPRDFEKRDWAKATRCRPSREAPGSANRVNSLGPRATQLAPVKVPAWEMG
mmetsp:Transcript_57559/g.108340  ORF Transcript_57559/g.108340 Transcript_57559/m.108340 type:complete len:275 (-) Transcript_57559:667-1491(-)